MPLSHHLKEKNVSFYRIYLELSEITHVIPRLSDFQIQLIRYTNNRLCINLLGMRMSYSKQWFRYDLNYSSGSMVASSKNSIFFLQVLASAVLHVKAADPVFVTSVVYPLVWSSLT